MLSNAKSTRYGVYGGAISADFGSESASFAHRDAFLVFQLYGSSIDNAPYPTDGISVIDQMLDSITTTPNGACTSQSLQPSRS